VRWLPARQLAVLAGKAHYLYLAIPATRFYLRELHDVLATRTGWKAGETHLPTATLPPMVDASPLRQQRQLYLLPNRVGVLALRQLRLRLASNSERAIRRTRFLSHANQQQHITWKELKAVRLAVLSFPPLPRGRKVLLHEDNKAVVVVLFSRVTTKP
jgi:hypothetical protein